MDMEEDEEGGLVDNPIHTYSQRATPDRKYEYVGSSTWNNLWKGESRKM